MENRFTSDFRTMINLTIWNSLGFFFLDFLIPFVASIEIEALLLILKFTIMEQLELSSIKIEMSVLNDLISKLSTELQDTIMELRDKLLRINDQKWEVNNLYRIAEFVHTQLLMKVHLMG